MKAFLRASYTDTGLFILRMGAGLLLMLGHGLPKLLQFSDRMDSFPDPLGVGSAVSLSLTVFAEVFCSLAVAVGLFTRLTVIPVIIMLLIAAFVIHGDDPWMKKEFALLYALPFLTLFFTGPGKLSVDKWVLK